MEEAAPRGTGGVKYSWFHFEARLLLTSTVYQIVLKIDWLSFFRVLSQGHYFDTPTTTTPDIPRSAMHVVVSYSSAPASTSMGRGEQHHRC
jgi:hypothetical protein